MAPQENRARRLVWVNQIRELGKDQGAVDQCEQFSFGRDNE